MLKDMKISHVEGCLENEKRINELSERLENSGVSGGAVSSGDKDRICRKIGELSEKIDELTENLKVIHAIVQSNQVEFVDHRKALVIIIEEHGIPCDDIFGWDLNNYRESKKEKKKEKKERKKNVRERRVSGNRYRDKDDNDREGSANERKTEKRKKKERKRGKKNERKQK